MLSASSGVMHNNIILYILHIASIIPRTIALSIVERSISFDQIRFLQRKKQSDAISRAFIAASRHHMPF